MSTSTLDRTTSKHKTTTTTSSSSSEVDTLVKTTSSKKSLLDYAMLNTRYLAAGLQIPGTINTQMATTQLMVYGAGVMTDTRPLRTNDAMTSVVSDGIINSMSAPESVVGLKISVNDPSVKTLQMTDSSLSLPPASVQRVASRLVNNTIAKDTVTGPSIPDSIRRTMVTKTSTLINKAITRQFVADRLPGKIDEDNNMMMTYEDVKQMADDANEVELPEVADVAEVQMTIVERINNRRRLRKQPELNVVDIGPHSQQPLNVVTVDENESDQVLQALLGGGKTIVETLGRVKDNDKVKELASKSIDTLGHVGWNVGTWAAGIGAQAGVAMAKGGVAATKYVAQGTAKSVATSWDSTKYVLWHRYFLENDVDDEKEKRGGVKLLRMLGNVVRGHEEKEKKKSTTKQDDEQKEEAEVTHAYSDFVQAREQALERKPATTNNNNNNDTDIDTDW
jgi:hypothetical protein